MSTAPNSAPGPDRDSLPFKKRDPKVDSPQQPSDAATFKAPYPYKSHNGLKTTHTGPFQPIPRRAPALYQPWVQMYTPTKAKTHIVSPFKEHPGWAEWREFGSLHPGWDLQHFHHQSHFSGHRRHPGLHPGQLHHPSNFRPISIVTEGFPGMGGGYSWEALTLREDSLSTERQTNGRNKGPYMKRIDRKMEHPLRSIKANPSSLGTCLPPTPMENLTPQDELMYKYQTARAVRHSFSVPSSHSSGKNFNDKYTSMRVKEGTAGSPVLCSSLQTSASSSSSSSSASPSSSSSSSPDRFPWLLPHFVAGSLIELKDGRLRRVEDLQTEDFLLSSLACPDLRLSCCTVQSISPSASSSSLSRLLILIHDQHSQELVDVYVEYPFFVRGRGWSSCCPQRTARLCGLQCRQLTVGDICLALTPASPPQPPPGATLKPKTAPSLPAAPEGPSGGRKKKADPVRRRHWSAPELRGSGTNYV
ncbi:uncharacterized protein LOC115358800 [Myripristis murdjan]|uniref:uncharacterized protein LOC115358800 n=1 Tax=Myripristis murdjan TaxID=586833 RepID=UPI001175CFDA|nr:uncharacterized protein LOC115358800 [Myripristis murdjan]